MIWERSAVVSGAHRAAVMLALLALLPACDRLEYQQNLKFDTDYQAVFMTNGQVLFGRLEDAGRPYPLLRDVYYLQSQVNPQTNQVASVLLKRGSELHGPEFMYLNSRQILAIEPVGRESRVAQLIEESRRQQVAGRPAAPATPAPR